MILCHFWNCKKCVFVLLKLHLFSNFRALCHTRMVKIFIFFIFLWGWSLLTTFRGLNGTPETKKCKKERMKKMCMLSLGLIIFYFIEDRSLHHKDSFAFSWCLTEWKTCSWRKCSDKDLVIYFRRFFFVIDTLLIWVNALTVKFLQGK